MPSVDVLFRAAHDLALRRGEIGAFPNTHYSNHPYPDTLYGVTFLNQGVVYDPYVPARVLGISQRPEVKELFRAAHDRAVGEGYVGGFPNFHHSDHAYPDTLYGIIYVTHAVGHYDPYVPSSHLGTRYDDPADVILRGAHNLAVRESNRNAIAAVPNFHYSPHPHPTTLNGVVFIKADTAQYDPYVPARDLRLPQEQPPPPPEPAPPVEPPPQPAPEKRTGTLMAGAAPLPGQVTFIFSGQTTNPLVWSQKQTIIRGVRNRTAHRYSLAHVDDVGRRSVFVNMPEDRTTVHDFDGMFVGGSWTAQVAGGPLWPSLVGFDIDWIED